MSKKAMLWRRKLSAAVERSPHFYRSVMVFRYRNVPFVRRIVSRGHDIVIEGFPRCANSFAVSAFALANGWRDPRVATHMHSPAQVVLAAEWNIPTILNIRAPNKAIPAFMAFAGKLGKIDAARLGTADKRAWVNEQTLRFARFYETTTPLHEHYVLSTFQQTTQDFGKVIAQTNERFGCNFDIFQHTDENVQKIFDYRAEHLSPDASRDNFKAEYAELYAEKANASARQRAEDIYLSALDKSKIEVPD
ncbi:hypothetical protein [Pelagimonas varians]|uniref:Sulfotransferase family protein n=2 Tax=Pelagimonas varians TaxID=696760 RepID=A0A238L691_9RHOB|nr:hypothetical protein C8N36_13211 [Pelagimonas varians]SMX50341.1 hypothetical protein PEV8663_04598 [Pelagimonas varians]